MSKRSSLGWLSTAALVACGTTPSEGTPRLARASGSVTLDPVAPASTSAAAPSACLAGEPSTLLPDRAIELSVVLSPPADAKEAWAKQILAAVDAHLALGEVSDQKHECFDTAFFENPSVPHVSVRVRTPPRSAPIGCDRKKHADLSLVRHEGARDAPPPASALKAEDELHLVLDAAGGCTASEQKSFKLEKASEGDTDAIARRACGEDCRATCGEVAVERWRVEHVGAGGCERPAKVFLEIWSRGHERVADLSLAIDGCVDRAALAKVARALHEALAPFAASSPARHKTTWATDCTAP